MRETAAIWEREQTLVCTLSTPYASVSNTGYTNEEHSYDHKLTVTRKQSELGEGMDKIHFQTFLFPTTHLLVRWLSAIYIMPRESGWRSN